MVDYKTYLKITHQGKKYELDGGMNRINSKETIYSLITSDFERVVAIEHHKNNKIEFFNLEFFPMVVVNKVKKFFEQKD